MRKLFSLFMALFATTTLWAYDFQSGDLYYNITSSSEPFTVEVTKNGIYTLTSVVIPASVEYNGITYAVASIGESAFYACTSLTSISIPNSVTTIGYLAFTGCSSLTSITIPNSVTDMGKPQNGGTYRGPVFTYCLALTSIVVEEGNPIYDSRDNCNAIVEKATNTIICGCKNTTFSQSVTGIGTYAFNGCSSLTSITIPNQVTNIQSNPFLSCSSLATIVVESGNPIYDSRDNCNAIIETATNTLIIGCQNTIIPNSVTGIGDWAFYGCSSLTSINIPENITSIGNSAFSNCSSLNSVTIGNSVTSIGNSAFSNCSSLISINIPEGVTSIEPSTFTGCSALTSINIPENVTSIGDYAFKNCDSLTSITIPKNVTSIGNQVFSSSLDTIYCYIVTPIQISASTFSNYYKAILFVPCESLDAYLADKVWKRFDNIQCLGNEIPQEGNSIYYTSSDGNIVTPNAYFSATDVFGANIVSNTYENGQGIITFDAPITSIGTDAFANCHTLTSITLPNSVTSIGDGAFVLCDSLSSITIPNGVTSIGISTFAYCSSLSSIALPNSVTSIGFHAFLGCYNLTSITIPNSVTSIGDEAFDGCSSLTSITIPNSVTSIGWNAFYHCYFADENFVNNSNCSSENVWGAIIVDDDVNGTLIKDNVVVYGRPNIDTSIIPEGVLSIKNGAFMGHERLTSVTIPSSVISIGLNAFYDCMLLKSIYCYALVPPIVEDWTLNYDATLYIPCEALEAYKAHEVWGRFNTIQCLEDSIPDPTERVLSCAEAVTVCLETGATATTEEYTIHGYVTKITTEYSEQYKNISFYMADTKDGGQVLFTYRIKPMYEADIAVKVGDFVEVVGKLVNYNGYLPEVYPGVYTIVNEPELPTGTSDIQLPTSNTKKVVKDGQLLILRDGKIYTVMGQEL